MKNFSLDSSMTAAIGGAFYPTGYSMVMFPDPDDAKRVGQQLADKGFSADAIYLIPPDILLSQITPTTSGGDNPLPSAGTEGATVRAYTKLAREGHGALLVKTKDEDAAKRLMDVVRTVPYSIAQRYRMLVIEDL
ncbi:hypothetical protein [Variovorax arabinosiphilus]|uniref:hypothetical protein n=1 Tax=Variovorax arabinosiphilus TaxID=3053498 RepID=UPI0025778FED|nr:MULTISPECIES: hypothetical protein [unclassified Variovorax]MDM0119892.1 hypothetical protein [Variovorax sp. J2L1-78]MDM0128196.1 hypothetical protein [Variovorax sp. J2L1-63]MDM0231896.1 hypothetical protein [Variovorax sp. J2R1-6]